MPSAPQVLIEQTDILGSLVLGGALLLERRMPQPSDDSSKRAMGAGVSPAADARWWGDGGSEPLLCECGADEALGAALALGSAVHVERAVWEAAATPASYSTQRGKMRVDLAPPTTGDEEGADAGPAAAPPLPWEISSVEELSAMSRESKARSGLAAGLRLPRARAATDEALNELLAPLLDEEVPPRVAVTSGGGAHGEHTPADAPTAATGAAPASARGRDQAGRLGRGSLADGLCVEAWRAAGDAAGGRG